MGKDDFYDKLVGRNIGLLSNEQQKKLRESCVGVFGLGGHGGVAAQLLTRCGIGHLKIVDIDVFEPSNLNRQIFAYTSTLQHSKVEVAARFLKDINPDLTLEKFDRHDDEAVNKMLDGTNVALMCIDKIIPSIHVARACREKEIPMIETVAIPFANLRVYTKDTMTFEEFHNMPTAHIATQGLYNLDKELTEQIFLKFAETYTKIESIKEFYDMNTVLYNWQRGFFPTLAPLVWLQGSLIALEAIKIILDWGKMSLVPNYALYDPFKYKIPKSK